MVALQATHSSANMIKLLTAQAVGGLPSLLLELKKQISGDGPKPEALAMRSLMDDLADGKLDGKSKAGNFFRDGLKE